MKNTFHIGLEERWDQFTLLEQMANIGAEVGRAIKWKDKSNTDLSTSALYRGLELFDLTIKDKKNKSSLKELLRVREAIVDFIIGENIYKSSNVIWGKYFLFFNIAARKDR